MDVIIVDDEQKSIELLAYQLSKGFNNYNVKGKYTNIAEAFKGILGFKPQVLFLDINMPSGSGLELLNQIKDMGILTIFLTAHTEYAIDAIKLSAFDYLLKPINVADLIRVDLKITQHLSKNIQSSKRRIKFQISNKNYIYELDDIIYAHSQGNYTTIYSTTKSPLVITKNLKKIEMDILSDLPYFRTHQSYIVNINHISEYSNHEIILSDKSKALLSSKKYSIVKDLLV